MENPRKSRLFYKARERIIDEIATSMVCEMIDIDAESGLSLPESWVKEAEQRKDNLLAELAEESQRESMEVEAFGHKVDRKPRSAS